MKDTFHSVVFSVEPKTLAVLAKLIDLNLFKPQWATDILASLQRLENMANQAEAKVAAFIADITPKLEALGANLDGLATSVANIAADEAGIKAALDAALAGADLGADTQAALQGVSDSLGLRVAASQKVAGDAKTLADSVPDTRGSE